MASRTISLENIQSHIDTFTNDFSNQKGKFSEIEDGIMQLKLNFQSSKSDFRQSLVDIQSDLLRKLKTNCQLSVDEFPEELYEEILKNFDGVLVYSNNRVDKLMEDLSSLEQEVSDRYEELTRDREFNAAVSPDDGHKPSQIHNLIILNSRKTDEPFFVMIMKPGSRYKCNGCKQNIPLQSFYLSHIEEYPSGSKTFIPHSYHMSRECLFQRGFDSEYLDRIDVKCTVEINKDIITILKEIGFDVKNSNLIDCHKSDSESDKVNDSDDAPDNVSEISDMSKISSVLLSGFSKLVFVYHRKPQIQEKIIICQGCKLSINTETYISLQEKSNLKPFHIKKSCLLEGDSLSDQLNNITVRVFKLLKTHNELKELIACGFYYKNIIGFRPSNPDVKQGYAKHGIRGQIKMTSINQSIPNRTFIFNNEPFVYENLPHGEKCKGCQQHIKKDQISLRHKERVPRDKLDYSPLISQYYHVEKECLLSRGFTIKYISFAKCTVMLSGDENLSRVTDVLIKCGFCNENICYSPKESNETRNRESNIKQPDQVEKDCKFYIDNCVKSNAHCEGCGFVLMPSQPCFVYALKNSQDSNATMFHIRSSCLKANFTKEQLMSITCVNNDSIDVSPNDIINCGLTKIVSCGAVKNDNTTNPFQSSNMYSNSKVIIPTSCSMNGKSQSRFDSFYQEDKKYLNNNVSCGSVKNDNTTNPFQSINMYSNSKVIIPTSCSMNGKSQSQFDSFHEGNKKYLSNNVTENTYVVETKHKNINEYSIRNYSRRISAFDVDVVTDHRLRCFTCAQILVSNEYVLKIKDWDPDKHQIHLDPDCVRRLGLSPYQLSVCKLSFKEKVNEEGLMRLRKCGFKKIPDDKCFII